MTHSPDSSVVCIRHCETSDMASVHTIYTNQVLNSTASYEVVPPSLEEMLSRRMHIVKLGFPYLVATIDEVIVGYAYAGRYRERIAYRHTTENSVYVDESARGRGVGKRLLLAVIQHCELMGLRTMVAMIGDSTNNASVKLHEACGFEYVGTLQQIGYKQDRWLDVVVMQRRLS